VDLEGKKRKILDEAEATWRMKSRVLWLKNGDENTKYFHNYAKHRQNINTIWKLQDEEGHS